VLPRTVEGTQVPNEDNQTDVYPHQELHLHPAVARQPVGNEHQQVLMEYDQGDNEESILAPLVLSLLAVEPVKLIVDSWVVERVLDESQNHGLASRVAEKYERKQVR